VVTSLLVLRLPAQRDQNEIANEIISFIKMEVNNSYSSIIKARKNTRVQ